MGEQTTKRFKIDEQTISSIVLFRLPIQVDTHQILGT